MRWHAEKQAWQEETGRKATGIQAIRPQTVTKGLLDNQGKDCGTGKTKGIICQLAAMGAPNPQAAEIQKAD
jgi:hypothetical protein